MAKIAFDHERPLDMILLGRVTIDFNPIDYYQTLGKSATFKKNVGGSPANIAIGLSRLGKRCGFLTRLSDDQFGDYVIDTLKAEGVDTTRIKRCANGETLGLAFTEILDREQSSILVGRGETADLSLDAGDVTEDYVKRAKSVFISGTALAQSPSREAALKAVMLARRSDTPVIFDLDRRMDDLAGTDALSIYYSMVARDADIIIGGREEYNLAEKLVREGMGDADSAAFWLALRASVVVIKHGRLGSTAYTRSGNRYTIKPFPMDKQKGLGGGDGYASAFLYGILEGRDIVDCLELGSASASLLAVSHGYSQNMPTLERLSEYIMECKEQFGEMIVRTGEDGPAARRD